jgi:hypothetical protein
MERVALQQGQTWFRFVDRDHSAMRVACGGALKSRSKVATKSSSMRAAAKRTKQEPAGTKRTPERIII